MFLVAPSSDGAQEEGGFLARRLKVIIATLLLSNVVWLGTPAAASVPVPVASATSVPSVPPQLATGKHPKLDSQLVAVASAASTAGVSESVRVAHGRNLTVSGASVRVVAQAKGDRSAVREAVRALGGRVEAEYANLVQAYVPVGALRTLAELPVVAYVGPPSVPVTSAVTDEGVVHTNANAWHGAGVSGAGVKVGIIDGGFIGYTAKQASGDLPASLTTADFGCGGVATGSDHGTAVAEIVHKMAPDAELYLICFDTLVNLGQAKDYSLAQGITIVNLSGGFFNTSRGDGTGTAGTPDAIVADARAHGILWVNAAGNSGQQHWSGTFVDADANSFHEFSPGDEGDTLYIAAGHSVCVFLKWNAWPATSQDFDLGLFRSADLSTPVASSTNFQNGSQAPTESLCYTNTTGGQNFAILIRKYAATSTPRFDLFVDRGAPEYVVAAGSLLEPASSPTTMAVGAICWQNNALQSYSSRGPTIDGRVKPDIAGQDATSSSDYGPASGCTGGFTGTSASAPHVAGAAALLAEANPSFTPAQIQAFLEELAVDLGPTGKDNSYGSGKLWLSDVWASPFTDIGTSGFRADIDWLYNSRITKGCALTTFCPDSPVTRGQMAAFLARAMSLPAATIDYFTDDDASIFEADINRLAEAGITTGCGGVKYCPELTITREQMAAYLDRALHLPSTLYDYFTDDDASIFEANINRVAAAGITKGCSATTYCPLLTVTRGQMAAFLHRAFGP